METNELYHRAVPIARIVREYMLAVEQAPPLNADGLDEDFRILQKFWLFLFDTPLFFYITSLL